MTNTARSIDAVESSLYARREALQAEQAKLNEEHGAAALAAAEGIADALFSNQSGWTIEPA